MRFPPIRRDLWERGSERAVGGGMFANLWRRGRQEPRVDLMNEEPRPMFGLLTEVPPRLPRRLRLPRDRLEGRRARDDGAP